MKESTQYSLYNDNKKKNSTTMSRSCVIYEYPKGGELFEYLFQTGKFHEAQARHYFKQLVDGLISIHKQGIYHGELTAEVIFFTDAKTIKIGELGLNQIRKKKYCKNNLKQYIAFESPSWAKENNNYEQSKDIFALGMILFILMVGRPIFSNTEKTNPNFSGFQTAPQAIWKLMQIDNQNVAFTDDFKDLIQGMLTDSPKNRLSLSEVYNHPWTQCNSEFTEEMVREFSSKQKKIEQCIIKETLTRQINKGKNIISNDKSILQGGLGQFRSDSDEQENQEIEQIQNISIKLIPVDLIRSDSYLISINPNLFMDLLKKQLEDNEYNLKIQKESEKYEFSLIIESETPTILKAEIAQLETRKNIICVNFKRQKGDYFDYIEKIKRFHELIDKIKSEQETKEKEKGI
ncbi:unnamed protein product (macronuclear) [Paramecium tetraurelia]|uniref:Protein kinase domain-containing protein n=1 Tax=Paramecium tetraurelia TaxID=5888 RepID=A0CAN4_PARTE|nr:uncharacterized protein GSPATT00036632001 [Paramecium tetraurelia]CAK67851.1 unnamed protein product [Paramecium tetraurelia]|eukprot:XP_001435248.1 hypothetical protein (macronuclear) [Paramecium tetraurelia strain d4-2]